MAQRIIYEPSRTLSEFRLLPGLTDDHCTIERVSLAAKLTVCSNGSVPLVLQIPLVSAAMQAVSGARMAAALAAQGGAAFIYCSQSSESQAAMVVEAKKVPLAISATAAVDSKGRPLVIAAINTHDFIERVPMLVKAEVDALAIDSSDGHSIYQKIVIDWVRKEYGNIPLIGGNIITAEAFRFLAEHGADAVKVGMGGGSICITQEQKGTGRGLATAIIEVCGERDRYHAETGRYLPVIADGGIVHSKDITMALAMGADVVMMGRWFARMEEAPTEKITINGRLMKPYWGEGSQRASEWKMNRYHQTKFAEGVEGFVEYAGNLAENLAGTLVKIKASMSSCGAATIEEFHRVAVLELVSALSIREGQVHDIFVPPGTRDGTGYQARSWGNGE